MNTVAVTVYAHQGDWNSANLWFDQTNQSVIDEIRVAKKQGLHVVLIMRVALDHAFQRNEFLWHGMIQPKSDAERDEWFERYQRFVLQWAKVAEEEEVDIFGIGSEMNSLTSTSQLKEQPPLYAYYLDSAKQEKYQEKLLLGSTDIESPHLLIPGGRRFETLAQYLRAQQAAQTAWAKEVSFAGEKNSLALINQRREKLRIHWVELIKKIREVYSGSLTYAANFDQFESVSFWKELDIMGINAYFSLREEYMEPRNEELLASVLERSWSEILTQIHALRQAESLPEMPLVFTELGYTQRENSTLEPWAMDGFSVVANGQGVKRIIWREQPKDLKERTLALRALQRANEKLEQPLLRGILYWKLSTIPSHREIEPFVHILGDAEDQEFAEALRSFL